MWHDVYVTYILCSVIQTIWFLTTIIDEAGAKEKERANDQERERIQLKWQFQVLGKRIISDRFRDGERIPFVCWTKTESNPFRNIWMVSTFVTFAFLTKNHNGMGNYVYWIDDIIAILMVTIKKMKFTGHCNCIQFLKKKQPTRTSRTTKVPVVPASTRCIVHLRQEAFCRATFTII